MHGFDPTLNELEREDHPSVIFRCVAGSRAYGTHHQNSDRDIRGIFVTPAAAFVSLQAPSQQVSDEKGDTVYYALHRFLELAASANPNILELLFMPQDCILRSTAHMQPLHEMRQIFITRQVYQSHVGYATAQIKKAKGKNKWINNPRPETPPQKEDFCWFIPLQAPQGRFPFRPIPIRESAYDLGKCKAASVDHFNGLYRLYDYEEPTLGVFRNGKLVCESIPIEDENTRCVGLMVYNKEAYEQEMHHHRNYWRWRKERNPHRWVSQERGEIDYDAKNMMHCFRLVLSASHILREGAPLVRFHGEPLLFLKQILAGRFSYEDLIEQLEARLSELNALHDSCDLPEKPDRHMVDQLLIDMTQSWEDVHA